MEKEIQSGSELSEIPRASRSGRFAWRDIWSSRFHLWILFSSSIENVLKRHANERSLAAVGTWKLVFRPMIMDDVKWKRCKFEWHLAIGVRGGCVPWGHSSGSNHADRLGGVTIGRSSRAKSNSNTISLFFEKRKPTHTHTHVQTLLERPTDRWMDWVERRKWFIAIGNGRNCSKGFPTVSDAMH